MILKLADNCRFVFKYHVNIRRMSENINLSSKYTYCEYERCFKGEHSESSYFYFPVDCLFQEQQKLPKEKDKIYKKIYEVKYN